jgi:type II secretory pathway pseudopilin PulG
MLELIFVIIVIGILTALAIPRMERDVRQEAADNILSAIRYTQHLALIDDKTDPFDANWQRELWQIRFNLNISGSDYTKIVYIIGSNTDHNTQISQNECAIDPTNGKYFYNQNANSVIDALESPNIFIGKKYGINRIDFAGGCSNSQHIAFDYLGRPHVNIYASGNDYASYMTDDCNLTFGFAGGEDDFSIIIKKETGYAYIVGQPDS